MALRRPRVRISLGPLSKARNGIISHPPASRKKFSEKPAVASAERERPNSPFRLKNQAGAVYSTTAHG
jgi:hypothetical protein